MQGRFLLDIVVCQGPSIFQLLSSKDKTLLIRRNAFFILNFGLDIFDSVRSFDLESDGLASQCLDKNLHASSQSQNQMKGRLLLDIVVRQGPSIFQLLSSKDKTLLVWWNALLILNFGLDVFNSVRSFNLECDGLASQCLTKICIPPLNLKPSEEWTPSGCCSQTRSF